MCWDSFLAKYPLVSLAAMALQLHAGMQPEALSKGIQSRPDKMGSTRGGSQVWHLLVQQRCETERCGWNSYQARL
jgi:hypothetical protein